MIGRRKITAVGNMNLKGDRVTGTNLPSDWWYLLNSLSGVQSASWWHIVAHR